VNDEKKKLRFQRKSPDRSEDEVGLVDKFLGFIQKTAAKDQGKITPEADEVNH
jgi:hypothetical protein